MRALKRAMGAFMFFCAFAFVSAMPVSAEETTVYADNTNYGDYSLYICSQRIIYNGEIPNGVELPAGVTIDYENRVITLDHATITGTTYSYGNETGIRYSAKDEKPLTIRLAGENTINNVIHHINNLRNHHGNGKLVNCWNNVVFRYIYDFITHC